MIAGALLPLIATALAVMRIDDHSYRRRAVRVCSEYAHRFPLGDLGSPYILDRPGIDLETTEQTYTQHRCQA